MQHYILHRVFLVVSMVGLRYRKSFCRLTDIFLPIRALRLNSTYLIMLYDNTTSRLGIHGVYGAVVNLSLVDWLLICLSIFSKPKYLLLLSA